MIPSPKNALSKPNHIIMWGGVQVKLGEEKIGWTCEHFCLSRLLDFDHIRVQFKHQLHVFITQFELNGNLLYEDATYLFSKILFKLTYEES